MPCFRTSLTAILASLAVHSPASLPAATKPNGIFASAGSTSDQVVGHNELRGVLIRATWSDIEPSPGNFDFSSLDLKLSKVRAEGKKWSLGVLGGGVGAPAWLMADLGVPYVNFSFRGVPGYRLPVFWDERVLDRIGMLAQALAAAYGDDESLSLVYVTQMTSNGIEGHLQGVNMGDMSTAGYTDEKWIEAAKAASRSYAAAFMEKAIAFEVHDVNGGATVPSRIINDLWAEPGLEKRVGAAMWWLSGSETYQAQLIQVLTDFPGDIYAQVIARSDSAERFGGGDFTTVFSQAKKIGIRYIEPWDFEFRSGVSLPNGAWDETFADFNQWADENSAQTSLSAGLLGPPGGSAAGTDFEFRWLAIKGETYSIMRSTDLDKWVPFAQVTSDRSDWISVNDTGALEPDGDTAAFFIIE